MYCELCHRGGSPNNPIILYKDFDGRMLFKCMECIERNKQPELPKNLVDGIK